jgi:hypothetical protein
MIAARERQPGTPAVPAASLQGAPRPERERRRPANSVWPRLALQPSPLRADAPAHGRHNATVRGGQQFLPEAASPPARIQRSPAGVDTPSGVPVGASVTRYLRQSAGAGSPLPATARMALESSYAADLGAVRVHADAAASQAADALQAEAVTLGSTIWFGHGRYRPDTPEGRRLLAHEVAHTVQQGGWYPRTHTRLDLGAPGDSAETAAQRAADAAQIGGVSRLAPGTDARIRRQRLADAPAAARGRLVVPSARPINLPQATIDAFFQTLPTGNYSVTHAAPAGTTVELGGIPAQHRVPMTSIAMELARQNYPSPATGSTVTVFAPGTTLTVHLNLSAHGLADGDYRFSWTGTATRGTIYIETLAAAPAALNTPSAPAPPAPPPQPAQTSAGGTPPAPALQPAPPMPSGTPITVGSLGFTLATPWPQDRFAHLIRALAQVPASALQTVDGLSFALRSGSGAGGEDGRYDETRHQVVMFASAWTSPNLSRYGDSPWPVYAIVHEIGHAVDRAPLRAAWQRYSSGSYATAAQQQAAETRLTGARSFSGARYVQQGGDFLLESPLTGTGGDFRQAAARDGVSLPRGSTTLSGAPTEWARSGWEDVYAESFALYNTDPALLELIRPNIFRYFARRFPR